MVTTKSGLHTLNLRGMCASVEVEDDEFFGLSSDSFLSALNHLSSETDDIDSWIPPPLGNARLCIILFVRNVGRVCSQLWLVCNSVSGPFKTNGPFNITSGGSTPFYWLAGDGGRGPKIVSKHFVNKQAFSILAMNRLLKVLEPPLPMVSSGRLPQSRVLF